MRPSMYTGEPFFRYSPAISAVLPKNATRCHSVCSCFSPLLSFHVSVVATLMFVTASPLGRYRTSGSLPRFPMSITLLTEAMSGLPCNQLKHIFFVKPRAVHLEVYPVLRGNHPRLTHASDRAQTRHQRL